MERSRNGWVTASRIVWGAVTGRASDGPAVMVIRTAPTQTAALRISTSSLPNETNARASLAFRREPQA
jgi:hypothetical protein